MTHSGGSSPTPRTSCARPLAMMRTRLDVAIAKPEGVPPQTQALDAGLRTDLDRADPLLESFLALARAQHGTLADRTTGLARSDRDRRARVATTTRSPSSSSRCDTALAPDRRCGQRDAARADGRERDRERGAAQPAARLHPRRLRDHWRRGASWSSRAAGRCSTRTPSRSSPNRSGASGTDRTGSQNGQGLGLSIVAAVADAHGGALELHARPRGRPARTNHTPVRHTSACRLRYRHEGSGRRGRAGFREH